MNFKEYKQLASRTINTDLSKEKLIKNAIFGIVGETGEVIDLMKKHFFHEHELDKEELKKELGDICWYLSLVDEIFHLDVRYSEISEYVYKSSDEQLFFDMTKPLYKICKEIDKPNLNNDFMLSKLIIESLILINMIGSKYDIEFNQILKSNIQKLMLRYPNGFETVASINRKEGE